MAVLKQDEHIDSAQKGILVVDVLKKQLIRALFIYLLVANVFIFLRMVLRLFGADPQNLFASFIFVISGFFLLPFFGIFPRFREEIIAGEPTADVSAFMGLFCLNILLFLLMSVIYITAQMVKTRKQARETVETSKPLNAIEAEDAVD